MKKFSSSLDQTSVVITASVSAVGLVLGYFALRRSGDGGVPVLLLFLGSAIVLGLLIATFLLKTNSILVDNTGITIDRTINPVKIAFSEIKAVQTDRDGEMTGVIRTFGNGGSFGYIGSFYNKKYGRMKLYCTQRKNYVIIDKTNGKRIIISPDNPPELLKELRSIQPSLVEAH